MERSTSGMPNDSSSRISARLTDDLGIFSERPAAEMLPSLAIEENAVDLFKATPGEHPAFNARAAADEKIAALGLEHIHLLQGAFMLMLAPGSPLIDYDKGSISVWGDGTQPIAMTTVDDTARMTARVALDRQVKSGKFSFYGDKLSFQQAADIAEARTGKTFTRRSFGTEADLRAAMAEKVTSDPQQAVMLAYQLYMLNGQTALEAPQSDRYPDITLQRFADFLAERLPAPGGKTADGRGDEQ